MIEISILAYSFGMTLRVGGNRNFKRCNAFQARRQFGGIGKAIGRGRKFFTALRPVAAQGDDMTHTRCPIAARNVQYLAFVRPDAGQMRGGGQIRLLDDACDRGMGVRARGAVRAVGHRDESRAERRQCLHGIPQVTLHFLCFWREEFKRDPSITGNVGEQ